MTADLRAALHAAQIAMISDPETRWITDPDGHSERFIPAHVAIRETNLARAALASTPEPAPVAEGLARALAYALTRATLPGKMETAGDYAARLAPLVLESGWLAASPSPETE